MAKNQKNAFVKNATIATLVALLLLFGISVPNASANTLENEALASTEQVTEPTIIYQDKIVEVEKVVEKEVLVDNDINHIYKTITTAAGCETAGSIAYVCSECEEHNYTEVIPATGHNYYVAKTTPVKGGANVVFACANCDNSYSQFVAAEEEVVHTHVYEVVDRANATCLSDGYIVNACECGSTYTETIEATGHEFGEWTVTTVATTTANAVESRECANCGETENREVEGSKIHVCEFVETENVEATCTSNGYVKSVCKCGETHNDIVPATGHKFGEWTITTAATTATNAIESRKCVTCGKEESREVEGTKIHACDYLLSGSKNATCENDGYKNYRCNCGESYTVVIPATGHAFSEWKITTAATTTANAVESRKCANCGETENREVEGSKIHVCEFVETENVEATCTSNGYVKSVCKCGETKVVEISATGHQFTEWNSVSTLSTFDKIVEVRECENCGETEVRETAIDHVHAYNLVIGSAVAPTCDNAGKEADQECVCGEKIKGAIIPALGHDYEVVDGTSVDATCTTAGKVSDKKCTHCGDVITGEEIAATGHNYEVVTDTEATCTEDGCHKESCTNCGDTVENHTDATGHAWGEYVYNNDATEMADGTETRRCENCGEQQTQTAEGTKIHVDWRGRTYISIDEFHWGYYTDDNGVVQCGSVENCKQYLAEKYPFLTVYEDANGVWAE